jgi:hypothetical protein
MLDEKDKEILTIRNFTPFQLLHRLYNPLQFNNQNVIEFFIPVSSFDCLNGLYNHSDLGQSLILVLVDVRTSKIVFIPKRFKNLLITYLNVCTSFNAIHSHR